MSKTPKSRRKGRLGKRIFSWRLRNISDKQFMAFLSILVGCLTGLAAVLIKGSVHYIRESLHQLDYHTYLYFIFPAVGISAAMFFSKYIIRRPIRHGVPNVLYAKGKAKGLMRIHNMFSSVVSSAFTVGFGGSVGLEGPTVSTGAAIGSNLGRFLHLRYSQIVLLLGCASAGAMAAIFKSPIAAIVFALEVIMLDLTMSSIVPLLMASASAVLVSYSLTGQDVLYPFQVEEGFVLKDLIYYILLGIVSGVVSVYFKKVYSVIEDWFEGVRKSYIRIIVGGLSLGLLLFLFPSLYGEGYEVINSCLKGNINYLYSNGIFSAFEGHTMAIICLLVVLMMLKVVAASVTFGAGGVGGIFAPTLFMGVHMGLAFALLINSTGLYALNINNFALSGMAGLIAGVLHAPLTGIFLIAELSGGYALFVPLMITATISYATIKAFEKHSVYTHQLAHRHELITHHKDNAILSMMEVSKLIETDFAPVSPNASLGDLTTVIEKAHRNLFPVVDEEGYLKGMVKMDDIRHLIFKHHLYDKTFVKDFMYMPKYYISPDDTIEDLVEKFKTSGRYNIAVIDKGKYIGFISRARLFTAYRNRMRRASEE